LNVITAGQPAWKYEGEGRWRPISGALPIIASSLKLRRVDIDTGTLIGLLNGEEPLREDLKLDETLRGSVLAVTFLQGVETLVPCWLGERLTLMLPDSERDILTHRLGLHQGAEEE
jgi:hypothetical protein